MARVKITKKIPKALSGLEMKMSAGLYGKGTNGNSQFRSSGTLEAGKISQQPTEVRNTLQPVAREDANLEAEKGETAMINIDGIPAHFKIGGKRHSEGGTPLNLPDNSFIFSDTAKMRIKDPIMLAQFGMVPKKSGYTPAEIAKKYDINKYRQILADPNTDNIDRSTAEMMISNYNMKLAKLALVQESTKGFPQGIPVVAMPYVMTSGMNPEELLATGTQGQEEQSDEDMGVSKYGGDLPKAQYGNDPFKEVGTEQWKKYSGKNDPSKSYFDRVKGAGLFQRPNSESIDPRMTEAFEKLIPFYGKESEGVGDYLKNLFLMPQYELNNLLTGYYENPYTTYKRYNKEPDSKVAKIAMKYGTDPLIIDLPYTLLGKGAAKAAPKVVNATKDLSKLIGKYGTKAYDAAVKKAMQLYDKITPEMVEKILNKSLNVSQKISQAVMHDEDGSPEMFKEVPKTREQIMQSVPTTPGSLLIPPPVKKDKKVLNTPVKKTKAEDMSIEELQKLLEEN